MPKPPDLNEPGYFQRIERKLDFLLRLNVLIAKTQGVVMADLSELQAEVQENTNATDSIVRLVTGLADQLEEALASDDPAAVEALVAQLRANTDALAGAVAANTEINPL